jgi:TolB-like protein
MTKPLLAFLGIVITATLRAADVAPPPITLAVLPFDATEEKLQGKAAEVAAMLSAQLSTNAGLWLVERAEVDKILSEQTLKLSGLADATSAAAVGKLTGARALITGRVIRSGDTVMLVVKLMSTENSRVFGETVTAASLDTMAKPIEELAEKIGKLVAKEREILAPLPATREQRIAKIRESLKGKALPSIQLKITEHSITRASIDPAVETEFGKTIGELGGEVVDGSQGVKPAEVLISGEAFSEIGARRGQLLSSRARVEVKAIRRSDGKLLVIDRETGVGVDIAESVAGKTALQNAALSLIERMLPQIVAP